MKKKKPGQSDSTVILVSFIEYGMTIEEVNEVGIDRFLKKPLFPLSIAGIIDEHLGITTQKTEEIVEDISGVFKGHRVLLAEDVEINREIVLALLEPTLLDIECAVNGTEAVNMFRESPDRYELIFMDLQMPEMDGYEAVRRIRALEVPHADTIPIVAMTANVFKEDIENCLKVGMNDHIGKPINLDDLISKLYEYLHIPRESTIFKKSD